MFNLEQSITGWRRQMAAGGIKSRETLDELESHLRDEIERQRQSGVDDRHAYQAAVDALGQTSELKTEFAKIAFGNRQPRQSFIRNVYAMTGVLVLLINLWTLLEYELSALERILGISTVSMICLYLVCLPRLVMSLGAAAYYRLAKAIKMASGLLWLWPICALLDAVNIIRLQIGIVPTVVLWCLFAAIVMTTVVYGLGGADLSRGDPGAPPPPFQPYPHRIPPTQPSPPDFATSRPPAEHVDPIVQRSLEVACGEASRLGHDFIGTEHVLLGLLKMANGSFANILRKLRVDGEMVRVEIERLVSAAPAHTSTAMIPITPRARKAIQLAAREAKTLNHSEISAEHIFLGLLLEGSGVAALVLQSLGINIKRTRQEILGELRTRPTS